MFVNFRANNFSGISLAPFGRMPLLVYKLLIFNKKISLCRQLSLSPNINLVSLQSRHIMIFVIYTKRCKSESTYLIFLLPYKRNSNSMLGLCWPPNQVAELSFIIILNTMQLFTIVEMNGINSFLENRWVGERILRSIVIYFQLNILNHYIK